MVALILAGGKGKRLGSELTQIPKVMRTALDKPLLQYVLEYMDFIPRENTVLLVGFRGEVVTAAFPDLKYAVQAEQKGTGHAVMCAEECFKDYEGDILVISGDMPLLKKDSLQAFCQKHKESGNACTILSFVAKGEIPPFGHIVRDEKGVVTAIVEHKDATDEQKQIRELNGGLYVFDCKKLFAALKKITPSSVTGEYYLTDVPHIMLSEGEGVDTYILDNPDELMGVSTEADLKEVERILLSK